MSTNLQSIRSIALTVPLALACAMPSVHAGDAKTYPGLMGVKVEKGGSVRYSRGAIGNTHTREWLYLDFPVLNDDMSKAIGYSNVRVIDRNYGYDISCSVNSGRRHNAAWQGYWGKKVSSNGTSNHLQTLNTGDVGGAGSYYHHYISCKVPSAYNGHYSYVISYYAKEK